MPFSIDYSFYNNLVIYIVLSGRTKGISCTALEHKEQYMNTKQLQYLLTIAQFGNLSGAARQLGITQPALSKLIHEWEEYYGFVFFLSLRRQLTPTAVGRYYLDYAQRILDEQNRMLLSMRNLGGEQGQSIRLCTAPNRAAIIYSRVYRQFARTYPDIELSLLEQYAQDQPTALTRGKADLALGAGNNTAEVSDIPFAKEELLVALPVSHPLASRKSIKLKELQDTPFALQGHHHSIRSIAEELFDLAGFKPVVVFQSDDVLLLDAMLHQGVGAGFVSRIHVNPCEELRYISLEPRVFQTMHIRYRKDKELTEAQRYLAGLLIRQRLEDKRYEAIPSKEVDELLNIVEHNAKMSFPEHFSFSNGSKADIADNVNEVNLDTNILKYMIAIVDEGSLSKAADRFLLAQPAMSRHLRKMERMLGMQLFSRKHNRLYPTNVGKIFVNSARNILMYEHEMENYIRKYRSGHGGRIFVHCDSVIYEYFFKNIEKPFLKAYPDMKLSVSVDGEDSVREALQNASSDIGVFLSANPRHKLLQYEVLGHTELVYIADTERPVGRDSIYDDMTDQETGERKLMLAYPDTGLRKEQDRLIGRIFDESPKIAVEAEFPILKELAVIGGGDSIMPFKFIPEKAKARAVSFEPPEIYYLVMASNPARVLPPSVLRLMDFIRDVLCKFMEE